MTENARDPRVPSETRKKAKPKGRGAKSDAVREAAILALLTEKSIADAADRCRVNESTLRHWLADDPTFKAAYDTARRAAFDGGIARVQALTKKGVTIAWAEEMRKELEQTAAP